MIKTPPPPLPDFRGWKQIEPDIRSALAAQGASGECIDFVLVRLHAALMKHGGFPALAGLAGEEAAEPLNDAYRAVAATLFVELAQTLVEVFRLRSGKGDDVSGGV